MSAALPFRLARATVFAVVCSGLAAVAHTFAGGSVTARGLSVAFVLTLAAAFPLTVRERTAADIVPVLAAMQVLLHLFFSVLHVSSPERLAGHLHMPSLSMIVLHAWAVVVTAWWLGRGEELFWTLLRRLGSRIVRVLSLPRPLSVTGVPVLVTSVVVKSTYRHSVEGRGPPL
ncbi:MFS transporter [Herbidospora sp. RD11066]